MATKYVNDTAAGKAISAWVILSKKGERLATVRAFHGQSCLVNVFDDDGFQHARASGYGYDKLTAALSGLTVAGHRLTDHCGERKTPPKGRKTWPRDAKAPRGWQFANFGEYWPDGRPVDRHGVKFEPDYAARYEAAKAAGEIESGWSSCFRISGLDYLRAMGLRVEQAI